MRKADVIIAGVAILLLALLTALRNGAHAPPSQPSTFDTGANGYAALYDLLRVERLNAGRFEDPIGTLPPNSATLVLARSGAFAAAVHNEQGERALDSWVRRGGTLVIADPYAMSRALGLRPARIRRESDAILAGGCGYHAAAAMQVGARLAATYAASCTPQRKTLLQAGGRAAAIAYRRGKGTVVAIAAPSIFDNTHLALRDNAAFAYGLFAESRNVLFDERIYGYAAGRSFGEVIGWPVRTAIAISIAALLLALVGSNVPFAPPLEAAPPDERDTSAYIASLARMLERGGASDAVIKRLADSANTILRSRGARDAEAAQIATELVQLQISSGPRAAARLLRAGRLYARVRKDYA